MEWFIGWTSFIADLNYLTFCMSCLFNALKNTMLHVAVLNFMPYKCCGELHFDLFILSVI